MGITCSGRGHQDGVLDNMSRSLFCTIAQERVDTFAEVGANVDWAYETKVAVADGSLMVSMDAASIGQ